MMCGGIPRVTLCLVAVVGLTHVGAFGQSGTYERTFPAPAATIKTLLQQMQGEMSGRLPVLEGFAVESNDHPLERYEKAYFQAVSDVHPISPGECVVRITAKVTAWYEDPGKFHSGYQLLPSNGRIENDILDQLSQHLTAEKTAPKRETQTAEVAHAGSPVAEPPKHTATKAAPARSGDDAIVSAPQPHLFDAPSSLSSSLSHGLASSEGSSGVGNTPSAPIYPERARLQTELEQLQEVVKTQAHPKNMVAVKKSGTAVVATPSLSAKPLFLATAHDEFEMLNFNQDWVHVRISGLSRGWIWRNDLEMPDSVPDTQSAPPKPTAADLFRVVREDTAPFPGDWEPLRGKNVKLISVQKADETKEAAPQMKLDFAKAVFAKSYTEMSKSPSMAGIVLIFDSADGGMIAATQPVLEKWKTGALTDNAFWHSCYFDPPETFSTGGNGASQ